VQVQKNTGVSPFRFAPGRDDVILFGWLKAIENKKKPPQLWAEAALLFELRYG
jgi:hypothetical protein